MYKGYRKPSIFSVNLFYLALAILFLTVGFLVQSRELYRGLLVTEYVLILFPNILFIKLKGLSLKKILRLNRFSLKQLAYTILIVLFSYPIAVFLNLIIMNIINIFTEFMPTTVPLPMTRSELFTSFLIIALSPGICEEVMFRGTMLSAYEAIGYKKAIVVSSILFGIFHFNITNLLGPTFLGIILAIVTIKSNSIFLSMIGHSLNNSIALLIGYFSVKYSPQLDSIDTSPETGLISDTAAIIISTITIGIIALLCGLVLYKLIRNFPTSYRQLGTNEAPSRSSLSYIPLAIVIILFFILTYFTLSYV